MNQLRNTLLKYIIFSDQQWETFYKILTTKKYKPGEYIIKPGENSGVIGYINKGIVRHYVIDDKGNDKTTDFCIEGEFTGTTNPFDTNKTNPYWIEALTNVEIDIMKSQDLIKFLEENKNIGDVLSKIMLPLINLKAEREMDLLTKDALGRYQSFLKRFPTLEGKISQYYIASYLGISPETLSRIKKKLLM